MKRLPWRQPVQRKVVIRIEPGKSSRVTRSARGGKVGTDQSASIGRVKRKSVSVNEKAHHDSEKRYGESNDEDDEQLNTPGIRICNFILLPTQNPGSDMLCPRLGTNQYQNP